MANISYRVTYAFDKKTTEEVTELAQRLNLSKSETVRHAIHQALEENKKSQRRSPQEAFQLLRQERSLPSGTGEKWMQEIIQEREQDSSQ